MKDILTYGSIGKSTLEIVVHAMHWERRLGF